ncbi:MAG: hypothetical protein ACLTXM_15965 [Enterococcus sp.]
MIVGIGLVVGILLLLFVRLRKFFRLRKVTDLSRYSEDFRNKYFHFKEKETQKATLSFMIISVLLSESVSNQAIRQVCQHLQTKNIQVYRRTDLISTEETSMEQAENDQNERSVIYITTSPFIRRIEGIAKWGR